MTRPGYVEEFILTTRSLIARLHAPPGPNLCEPPRPGFSGPFRAPNPRIQPENRDKTVFMLKSRNFFIGQCSPPHEVANGTRMKAIRTSEIAQLHAHTARPVQT